MCRAGKYGAVLGLVFGLLPTASVLAELRPDEVAVIAIRRSPDSRKLAEYYLQARGIPAAHLLLLDIPPSRTLSRAGWDREVRPAIRHWLLEQSPPDKIRCLVTVWDVPLKIGRSEGPAHQAQVTFLEENRRFVVSRLGDLIGELDQVLPHGDAPLTLPDADKANAKEWAEVMNRGVQRTQQRLAKESDLARLKPATEQLVRLIARGGGIAAQLRTLRATTDSGEAQRSFEEGRRRGLAQGLAVLQRMPDSAEKDELSLSLVEEADGLVGALAWVDSELQVARKNESESSFDSELSLVLWPGYPLIRWQPNLLYYRYDGSSARLFRKTMMVSRIEAPTWDLARKLIDTAIETESHGLKGKFYIDARGIKSKQQPLPPGSYAQYDQSLRDLHEVLEKATQMETVLDDKQELFQPGACPQAILYCGWYSLGRYVDAFDWQPGAVAYHIASSEAVTLRDADSQVWCKRMLEDGVCATLGPAFEPYLAAFPLPDEFFVTLLSGRYTLVETYYRTLPFSSWAMLLVGDPLYQPFKITSPLKIDALPERLRAIVGE